ncbi:MAG: glycosyltransferase family 2 protein [Prolixibacteraceae bacterium]|nr:glycosyltransferase family 2 protein [Prolixibacteraceae bacterium]
MKIFFWILFFSVFYTYIGYAVIIYLLALFRKKGEKPETGIPNDELPPVSLFITAYNEKPILAEKMTNCLQLDYPKNKLQIVFVTDGSTDGSPEFLKAYDGVTVYHHPERRGKMHAMNRGMQFVKNPFVIFTDANTALNPEAIKEIIGEFSNPRVGCVAGRKKVINTGANSASETGEGLYWKFESWLKENDARLYSAVGAVGELFAIRTSLFEPVENDTVLDDLIISFRILEKGYRLSYAPGAIASEKASFNVQEELKRKKRIAAGGLQTLFRMPGLLNPFKYGMLSFQYFSHKVTRWTFSPWCLFLMFPVNLTIVLAYPQNVLFIIFFSVQVLFYLAAFLGWLLDRKQVHLKILFIPFYFTAIHAATIAGQFRYFRGKQPASWEKAKRI